MKNTMNAKTIMKAIAQERKEFTLTDEIYNSLSLDVQKELDKNYWRFHVGTKGYLFEEMDAEEKAHFEDKEMVIHHSIFEKC